MTVKLKRQLSQNITTNLLLIFGYSFMLLWLSSHVNQFTIVAEDHSNIIPSNLSFYNTTFFPFYIFQIGFNKAGTTTLYKHFKANNVPSIHSGLFSSFTNKTYIPKQFENYSKVSLYDIMHHGYKMHEPLLYDLPLHYRYYGDFQVRNKENDNYSKREWYRLLLETYPKYDMKFILNIRNVNHWLRSRFFHDNGKLFERHKQLVNASDDVELLNYWHDTWYQYICDALNYFRQNKISNNLLIYDIENDSSDKIVKFFNNYNLNFKTLSELNRNGNPTYLKKHTIDKQKQNYKEALQKWQNIINRFPNFALDDGEDGFNSEYERIAHVCNITINTIVYI